MAELNNLAQASTLSLPEKAALSKTTTVCCDDKTPRASKDALSVKSNPFDTDVEACLETSNSHELQNVGTGMTTSTSRPCHVRSKSDAHVWPGQAHWKQKAKLAKAQRGFCTPLAGLSRRNRIIAKIVMILLIVGIAVGVGFGISIPLGAPIWGDKNND